MVWRAKCRIYCYSGGRGLIQPEATGGHCKGNRCVRLVFIITAVLYSPARCYKKSSANIFDTNVRVYLPSTYACTRGVNARRVVELITEAERNYARNVHVIIISGFGLYLYTLAADRRYEYVMYRLDVERKGSST